jgi:protease I
LRQAGAETPIVSPVAPKVVRGRRLTSFPSVQTDLKNAGAKWTNQKIVADRNLLTSRKPADIPSFNREIVRAFAGK